LKQTPAPHPEKAAEAWKTAAEVWLDAGLSEMTPKEVQRLSLASLLPGPPKASKEKESKEGKEGPPVPLTPGLQPNGAAATAAANLAGRAKEAEGSQAQDAAEATAEATAQAAAEAAAEAEARSAQAVADAAANAAAARLLELCSCSKAILRKVEAAMAAQASPRVAPPAQPIMAQASAARRTFDI